MTSRLVITNAAAGGSDADAIEAAVEVLRDDGPVTVEASADADELTDVLRRWSDDPDRAAVLVAAGGDGSLHALVAALHRLDLLDEAVVGLVPLGTGNDFARTVDIATDPAEAARQHVAGRPHRLDLLVASDGSVVVNARYEDERSVILTTNIQSRDELVEQIGERTVSRLQEMCDLIPLHGDDARSTYQAVRAS